MAPPSVPATWPPTPWTLPTALPATLAAPSALGLRPWSAPSAVAPSLPPTLPTSVVPVAPRFASPLAWPPSDFTAPTREWKRDVSQPEAARRGALVALLQGCVGADVRAGLER